jgi:hypothetical protein
MNSRWTLIGVSMATGVAIGVAASWTWLEDRSNRKYQAWVATRVATEDHVAAMRVKREVATEPLDQPTPLQELKQELNENLAVHEKLAEVYKPTGRSYSEFEIITDEEYADREEHDYDKITIEIYRDDLQYQLVMDGETVLDWKDVLTPDIIENLKGQDGIFLRNHRKREDYFITWGQP